jgi:hypothetical protein
MFPNTDRKILAILILAGEGLARKYNYIYRSIFGNR